MKKIMKTSFGTVLLITLFVSCSAAHQAQVREKIRNNQQITQEQSINKNQSQYPNENTRVVAVTQTTEKTIISQSKETSENKKSNSPTQKTTTKIVIENTEFTPKRTTVRPRSAENITAYLEEFVDIAKENMRQHKIPASITLAQGILESGIGKSKLAQEANNHFGIKCKENWEGEATVHTDDRPNECFRKYDSAEDSYRDHALFLANRSYYAPLFQLDISDYAAWAHGLKNAGYASDKKYPDKLIGLIERYELNEFDQQVLAETSTPTIYIPKEATEEEKQLAEEINKIIEETKKEAEKAVKEASIEKKNAEKQTEITERKTESIGLVGAWHEVQTGDTLFSISRAYGVAISKIQELNNLTDFNIKVGQRLRIK